MRRLLLWLTLLPVDEIDAVMQRHEAAPQHREAQRLLAREVVTVVHGAGAVAEAEAATSAWTNELSPELLRSLESSLPTTEVASSRLPVRLVDLLVETGLAASKSAAVRLVRQGGAYANDRKIHDEEHAIDAASFIDDRWLLLRAGKRHQHLVVLTPSG